jgi:hypothetical protein
MSQVPFSMRRHEKEDACMERRRSFSNKFEVMLDEVYEMVS